MKGFKEQLKRDLQHDAPYTNELKQRLLQTKQQPKKRNWQVLSVTIGLFALIAMIMLIQFAPQQSAQTASEGHQLLPIIDDVSGLEVIKPNYAEIIGEQWNLHFLPMIINRQEKITYGDYVAFYGEDGLVVSTVFGLRNDRVTMNEGQILVNDKPLNIHGLGEIIPYEHRNDAFLNPYFIRTRANTFGEFINETIKAERDELVVYEVGDKNKNKLLKINENQLAGKVVGFQNFELTFHLTEEEQKAFDLFKTDYNLQHLKDVSPVAITKMYLLSDAALDMETYEALLTTNINMETETIRNYYKKTKRIRQEMFTKETSELSIAYLFAGLENAHFEQLSDTKGIVKFISINGSETGLNMEKNEDGIWQPAFTHAYY